MNISILLISIYIFLETIGYGVYEFKNQNKFGGILVCVLSIFMVILVNVSISNFI